MNYECKPTNGLNSDCAAVSELKKENEILKRAYWLAITTIVNDMGDEAEDKNKVMENLIKWYIKQAKKEIENEQLSATNGNNL